MADVLGNRGKCAGTCRLPYELVSKSIDKETVLDKGYLLSTKDLCGLSYIPDLINIGVSSLKIEGRMKTPEYVATVTRIYRKYIDLAYSGNNYTIDPQDQKDLLQVFNRGGFSTGHYSQDPNRNLIFKEKPNNMGIYVGNVANYNQAKGHITLNLNDNLTIGDTITFEKEETKYKISELMMGKKNIDYATDGMLITIGRMKGNIHPGDKIYKLESKTLSTKALSSYQGENKKHLLNCKIEIHKGSPIIIQINDNNGLNFNIVSSIIPDNAIRQPITKERIIEQFSKTGNTSFVFEDFDIDLEDDLYINISDLNELRRNCIEKATDLIVNSKKRTLPKDIPASINISKIESTAVNKKQKISLLLNVLDVSTNYGELEDVDSIYIPLKYFTKSGYSNIIKSISVKFNTYIYMPPIIKSNYRNLFMTHIDKALSEYNIKGFVLSNLGTFKMLEKYKSQYEFIGNYTLNVFNSISIEEYSKLGLSKITISPELNKQDIIDICNSSKKETELTVYGNTPVMTTGYCVLGNSNKCYPNCKTLCRSKYKYYLKDRLGLYFRVLPDNTQTINTIYNSKITSIDFSGLDVSSVRIDILDENILEINDIIKTVKQKKRFDGKDYTNADFIREV